MATQNTPGSPQQKLNPNLVTGKPAAPRRLSSRMAKAPATQNQQSLDQFLLKIVTSNADEQIKRAAFRQLVIEKTEAIGVCHVHRDNDGEWEVENGHVSGRVIKRIDFSEKLITAIDSSLTRNAIQLHPLTEIKNAQAFLAPAAVYGVRPEVLVVTAPKKAQVGPMLANLEKIIASFRFWLKANATLKNEWKLNSLATMIELISKVEACHSTKEACDLVAAEFAGNFDCTFAIGAGVKKPRQIRSISGIAKLKRNSKRVWAFQQVANEAALREESGRFPALSDHENGVLLAHQQLAASGQFECVRSKPIVSAESKTVGYAIVAGSMANVGSERMQKFLDACGPRLASALEVVERAERSSFIRFMKSIPQKLKNIKAAIATSLLLGIVLLMFVPVPYRVRCNCVVEPVNQRFAVAPFEGIVKESFCKPGDMVHEGEVLALMDGRETRWEISEATAQLEQAQKKHEIELAQRNVSEAMLAQLEHQRITAQLRLLNFQKSNLEIKSPTDGVVLSGSPERTNASSVTTGDLMFEIAPMSPLRIEIEIPAEDILYVEPGMKMKVWVEGHEQNEIEGEVTRINPRSEVRNAQNVFVGVLEIDNSEHRFRPGMKGTARVDSRSYPLGWNLFHKPYDYLTAHWLSW